eukprot:TRINITY_DN81_c0_g1_i1.p1 TRINITY_DN81_c0_g1~~TRINITY_DN81_c0_g1_i1.p1  ORF type:complete len:139 (+),score=8.78 TRINITY_DN81_c0_g1_i1:43-459(+)
MFMKFVLFFITLFFFTLSQNCPSGTCDVTTETCCAASGPDEWGCCPYPNAVCCSDKQHCCPKGYKCDTTLSECVQAEIDEPMDTCPSGTCPSTETCCALGTSWGCCPYQNANCCSDHTHCCPSGYTCNLSNYQCVMNS